MKGTGIAIVAGGATLGADAVAAEAKAAEERIAWEIAMARMRGVDREKRQKEEEQWEQAAAAKELVERDALVEWDELGERML